MPIQRAKPRFTEVKNVSNITADQLNIGQIGGRRNMVINGAMQVAQRGTSFTSIGNNIYSLDRWLYYLAGSSSVSDASQSTDTPNNNFKNSLKLDVQTADASVAANDLTCFLQKIEGQNVYQLGWGTADAETVTLSFWVKSTKTGIHSGAFKNSAQDRSYVFEYTVNASNTWEYKTITVAGDTTGTWLTTNGIGVQVTFALMAGTDFTKTAGSWGAGNNYGSDNQVNVMDSASNEWYITGVQLEVGEQATPFEHRSYGEELELAYRYYYRWSAAGHNYGNLMMGNTMTTTTCRGVLNLPVTMRATPATAYSGTFRVYDGSDSRSVSGITIQRGSNYHLFMQFAGSSYTTNRMSEMGANNDSDAYIEFDAEL